MLKRLIKLIKALNGNLRKEQIAAGFSWGFLLGLIPAGNVFWIALFFVSFCFRHHNISKLLVFAIIKIFINPINYGLDEIGFNILTYESFGPFFTTLYNTPFVVFTGFNNTLVAGGLVSGVVLFIPVYILVVLLVPPYRNKVVPKLRDSKALAFIKKMPIIAPLISAFTKVKV